MRRVIKGMLGLFAVLLACVWLVAMRFEELFLKIQPVLLAGALRRELGEEQAKRILSATMRNHEEILARHPGREKGVMRFHRTYMMFWLAVYRALGEELAGEEDLVEKTHRLMWEGSEDLFRVLFFGLQLSSDPFGSWAKVLIPVNEIFFPSPPWERKQVEMAGGVGFDYSKCPYHDFLVDEGAKELTSAFCDMDWRQAELCPPQIIMQREHTLGNGDEVCDFRYYRKQ